jgi:hypothetical protein
MTQIATQKVASIQAGPRGIGARAVGGAYVQDCQTDIGDPDSFELAPIILSGTTDALAPVINQQTGAHAGGNYIITTGSADACTLPTPTAGVDDNLNVNVWSASNFAHTITCATTVIAGGVALKTVITFPAFAGAGVSLRAYNGTWQVIGMSPSMTSAGNLS